MGAKEHQAAWDALRRERDGLRAKVTEQSAEIWRLKTVPMKYRRMAFNAQLQDENAALRAKVAELEEKLKYSGMAATAEARRGDELQAKVAELEKERDAAWSINPTVSERLLQSKIATLAALIEKCENSILMAKRHLNVESDPWVVCKEALAAIAAYKK